MRILPQDACGVSTLPDSAAEDADLTGTGRKVDQMCGRVLTAALCAMLSGCAAGSIASNEDANVASSLQYDTIACSSLIAQRNALAARYGLPQDAKPGFSKVPVGLGTVVPDMRNTRKRDTDQAAGRIDAMNRSLIRRQCIPKPATG